jgi:hypothetical protein
VGAGVVDAGAVVCGGGDEGAVVGAAVVGTVLCVGEGEGGAVVARTVGGGDVGDAEELAVALGEDDADDGATRAPPRKTTPIRRIVMRLPATAASPRSIQRGPLRRGGGMSFVVSPGDPCVMRAGVARDVPLTARACARSFAR